MTTDFAALTAGDRSYLDGLSLWMDNEVERAEATPKPCPGCTERCRQCGEEALD